MRNSEGTEWTLDKCHRMLFKFASDGSVEHIDTLKQILLSEQKQGAKRLSCHTSASNFGALRDEKQRTLLHVAAKKGRSETIRYLVDSGVPVDALDHHGNTAALLFLKACVKAARRQRQRKKRSKRSTSDSGYNYMQCCEVLRVLLKTSPSLLTTPNRHGQRPTELLQTLFDSANEEERKEGDKILMSEMATESTSSRYLTNPQADESTSFCRTAECAFFDEDESYEGFTHTEPSYAWEDYFSGFSDQPWKSHLDTIREEFELRNRSSVPRDNATRKNAPTPEPSTDEQRASFFRRHEAAISRKRASQAEITLEQFQEKWNQFTLLDTQIASIAEIPWPPFCDKIERTNQRSSAELRIDAVLKFVGDSVQSLRRLQVDWHPDRFSSRFGARLKAEIKQEVDKKVVAISQLLNTAMDTLRKRQS
ncbi:ankyrin repeat protein, partial [Opisthorchis viverrini]